ncbi:MAG TPA: 1-acyl-sn-glycerol-3-phosphate acyltransferase [Flavobacterium sp.]|nr:1-acyl-sn-glycerol-3-phosphate acyltransferase [Flavobacterium sp.]
MHDFFYAIHSFVNRRKFLSAMLFIGLLFLLGFCASQLKFSEDITRLIPANNQSDTTAKVLKQMNFADKISIIISSENNAAPEELTACANEFLDSIDKDCKKYVGKVQGKIDEQHIMETFDFVYDNLPLFLDEKDYKNIDNKIQDDSIAKIVEGSYKSLISPTGIVSRDFILKDPLGISFIALKKLQQLSVGDDFQLQDGFVITKDKKNLLLFITPKLPTNETDENTIFIGKLHEIKDRLNTKFKGKATLSFYGATPVAVANATQIKADVRNTSIFAMATLILILIFFYRNISTPILIFIPSICGAIFALAVLYFLKGSISAISLGISSILLGETTDYSIYVLTHLRNNKNVKLLYKDISKPLILCGTTTAISFLCLYFVKSEALQDLGIFAALSVIATSVFSLLLIPVLYRTKNKIIVPKANIIDKLGTYPYQKNKFLVACALGLLVICLFNYSKVTFNNDLSALNFVPSELKQTEHKLEKIANISSKSIYLATYGDNYETVLENNNLLFDKLNTQKHAGGIVNFSSIGGIVFSNQVQEEKIGHWNAFWTPEKKAALQSRLIASGKPYGFKENSFHGFYETLDKKFTDVSMAEYKKVRSFFIEEFVAEKNGFYTVSTLVKVPAEKRDAFVAQIKKSPNIVVIDRQETNEAFLGGLKKNFENLIDYSFIAIFLILLVAFRRIELVIVSIMPILVSWIFTTGLMGIFDLQFNIINIIVCTLIFGIGVDYSIFMTAGLQKDHTYGSKVLPTYKTSILLSVATTILGIGVLIFAKHPALKSIALIAIIGIFSTLLITFILQPLVFRFFVTGRTEKGKPPFQILTLIHSILSFMYFGFGGLFFSLMTIVLKILPFSDKTKMRWFRFHMSKLMGSVLYTNYFVKKTILNKNNEKFDKPAVIIANHTSFLDILAVGMLSPKTIYLVSDWVYNSPVFGKAVRSAGFYPVSEGIEGGVEHLRKKVEEGYSLIVYPEGTRSKSSQIQRFHKGAFYLAEHFNLDIIPVVIHGNSEALPKGDFIIYDGPITVNILERIKPEDEQFGDNYTERTKKTAAFFRSELKKMRDTIEGPEYFRKIIINSFDYKEYEIIAAVKKDIAENLKRYHELNKYIPGKATILHLANDYGQLDALLALQEPQRKIHSFIADEEKRAVAKTNYIVKKRTIQYLDTNPLPESQKYGILLISDPNYNADIAALSDKIILLNVPDLKAAILDLGFEIETTSGAIIVLKKKL